MKKILKEWRTFAEANESSRVDKGLPDYGQPDGLMKKFIYALENDAFHSATGSHRKQFEKIVGEEALGRIGEDLLRKTQELEDKQQEIKRKTTDYRSYKRAIRKFEKAKDAPLHAKNGIGYYLSFYVDDPDKFKELADLKAQIFLDSLSKEEISWIKQNFFDFIRETVASTVTNVASVWTGKISPSGKPTPKRGVKTVIGGQVGDWFFGNPDGWPYGAYGLVVKSIREKLGLPDKEPIDKIPRGMPSDRKKSSRARSIEDFYKNLGK